MKKILVLNKADTQKLTARANQVGRKAVDLGHAERCLVTTLGNGQTPVQKNIE